MQIKRLPNRTFIKKLPEVGSKIKSAREECGLSQKELAHYLGLKTATAVSLYESNDREVSAVRMWQIAVITNLPLDYFLLAFSKK